MTMLTSHRPRRRLFRLGQSDEFGSQAIVLTLVALVAPAAFLWCGSLAGGEVSPWLLLLLPLLLLVVTRTNTILLAVLWVLLGVIWLAQVPAPFTWWAVPAAAVALVAHVAGSLLAGAPTTATWPRPTIRRIGRRVAVVLAVTVGVAAVAQVTLTVRTPGVLWLGVAALALVAGWLAGGQLLDRAPAETDG